MTISFSPGLLTLRVRDCHYQLMFSPLWVTSARVFTKWLADTFAHFPRQGVTIVSFPRRLALSAEQLRD